MEAQYPATIAEQDFPLEFKPDMTEAAKAAQQKKAKRMRLVMLATSGLATILSLAAAYQMAHEIMGPAHQLLMSAAAGSAAVFGSLIKDNVANFIEKLSPTKRRVVGAAGTGLGLASFGVIADQAARAMLIPNGAELLAQYPAGIPLEAITMPGFVGYMAAPAMTIVAGLVTMAVASKTLSPDLSEKSKHQLNKALIVGGTAMTIAGGIGIYEGYTHPTEAAMFDYGLMQKMVVPFMETIIGVQALFKGAQGEISKAAKDFSTTFSSEINGLSNSFKTAIGLPEGFKLDDDAKTSLKAALGVAIGTGVAVAPVLYNLNDLIHKDLYTDMMLTTSIFVPLGTYVACASAKKLAEVQAKRSERDMNASASASLTCEMK